jgi:hypothetical protein
MMGLLSLEEIALSVAEGGHGRELRFVLKLSKDERPGEWRSNFVTLRVRGSRAPHERFQGSVLRVYDCQRRHRPTATVVP